MYPHKRGVIEDFQVRNFSFASLTNEMFSFLETMILILFSLHVLER